MARGKEPLSLEAALPPGQKPTLKTIAQMSGLAVPTVSRALNDAPDIGRATKQLVREIADTIGYVPNRAGVRLRTGRTNVISLVMSTQHDNHTAQLISSMAGGLQGTRYHLNVTPFSPRDDLMKPVRYIVETGSADGVVLNQIEPEDPRIAYLIEKKIPFATHGRTIWSKSHSFYDFDNETFGRLAIGMLAERNRRKVAVIVPPMKQAYSRHLVAGLNKAAERHGIEISPMSGVTCDDTIQAITQATLDKLRCNEGYDAIVAGSTIAAQAAMAAADRLNLKLGTGFDVISKDSAGFLSTQRKEILTLPESVGTAGDFLAKAVLQAIQHPDWPPMQFLEVPAR